MENKTKATGVVLTLLEGKRKAEEVYNFRSYARSVMQSCVRQNDQKYREHMSRFDWQMRKDNEYATQRIGRDIAKKMAIALKHYDKHVDGQDLISVEDFFNSLATNLYRFPVNCKNKIASRMIEVERMFNSSETILEGNWVAIDFKSYGYGHVSTPRLHALHYSIKDPSQVAYYPTLKHYVEGREVRCRLGKYLSKYKEWFKFNDEDVKRIVDRFTADMKGREQWEVRFIDNDNPDGWVSVYASEYVDSCMQGESAVRIYAHPKSPLRLAYLLQPMEDEDNRIIARCIVRTNSDGQDKQGHVRVYPDPNASSAGRYLLDQLSGMGYAEHTNLIGVKLRKEYENGDIVAPYLDYGKDGTQNVDEYDDYLIVTEDGSYCADNTDGFLLSEEERDGEDNPYCESCQENVDYDDSDMRRCIDGDYICPYCVEHRYVEVNLNRGHTGIGHPNSDSIIQCESDDEYYLNDADVLKYYGISRCEQTDDFYKDEDLVMTSRGLIHNGLVTELDVPDAEGNTWAHDRDIATLSNGMVCHKDNVDAYEEQIEEGAFKNECESSGQTDTCPVVEPEPETQKLKPGMLVELLKPESVTGNFIYPAGTVAQVLSLISINENLFYAKFDDGRVWVLLVNEVRTIGE